MLNMADNAVNIYRRARKTAGLTQERWAEALGISVDRIQDFESGRALPSDELVTRMVETSPFPLPVLGYWHLKNKSGLANDLLPEIRECSLPQAVLSLMVELQDFGAGAMTDLLRIAADGKVDAAEASQYKTALAELEEIIRLALGVKYAREG